MNPATLAKLKKLAKSGSSGQEASPAKALIDLIDETVLRRLLQVAIGEKVSLQLIVGSRRLEKIVSVEGVDTSGAEAVLDSWLFGGDEEAIAQVASLFRKCLGSGEAPKLVKSTAAAGDDSILDNGIPSVKIAEAMG